MNKAEPHSSNLRLHRLKDAPATFFVTKTLWPKKPVLTRAMRQLICSSFRFAVQHKRILLRAFVVMPDHWHGLFGLLGDWSLPRFVHAMMSFVGGETAGDLARQGTEWEEGYHDTRIRSMKQFHYVADYIALNPVRKGLATTPEEWDASHLRFPELVTHPWPWTFEKDSEE